MTNNTLPSTSGEFLDKLCPNGPWRLIAIPLTKDEKIVGKHCTTIKQCEEFLATHNGKSNLYFTINPTKNAQHKKPFKQDIKQAEWLWVDIDSDVTDPNKLASDKTKILRGLIEDKPKHIPSPTIILNSGNGYWGFWRLEKPLELKDNKWIEEYEKYNKWLAAEFNGDHCHNVERIARIPFTLNIPTATKKKKGRKECRTSLIAFSDLAFDIKEFKKLEDGEKGASTSTASQQIDVNAANIEIDELEIPDQLRLVILQAVDAENPRKNKDGSEADNTASGWLFWAVRQLLHLEFSHTDIYKILMDKRYKISEHVYNQKETADKYARKQIINAVKSLETHPITSKKKKAKGSFSKHIADVILKQHPDMIPIYTGNEEETGSSTNPMGFLEFSTSKGWEFYSYLKLKNIAMNIVYEAKGRDGAIGVCSNAIAMVVSQIKEGLYLTDIDRSLNSIPLATPGKSIDLTSGKVIASPRDDVFMKKLPVEEKYFNEKTFNESKFNKYLNDWFTEKDEKDEGVSQKEFMQVMIGQALLGNPTDSIVFSVGRGGNGKTLFNEFIMQALGKFCATIPIKYFLNSGKSYPQHETGLMNLRYARWLVSGEIDSPKMRWNSGQLKNISGGDEIAARGMRENYTYFKPICVPLIFGNHDPICDDKSEGMKRRLKVIRFENDLIGEKDVSKIDIEEQAQLPSEQGAVLFWVMQGLQKFHAAGKKLPYCKKINDDTLQYFDLEDTLQDVLDEFLIKDSPVEDDIVVVQVLLQYLQQSYPSTYMRKGMPLFCRELRDKGLHLEKFRNMSNKICIKGYGWNYTHPLVTKSSPAALLNDPHYFRNIEEQARQEQRNFDAAIASSGDEQDIPAEQRVTGDDIPF